MVELKKEGYLKQLTLYLNNGDYEQAYGLAKEFAAKYPAEFASNFLLAKAAFWVGKYEETIAHATKASNLSPLPDDLLVCTILASTAYYKLGRYKEGLELLKRMDKKSEDLEKLLFIFSLTMNDEKEAKIHMDELYRLNKRAAVRILRRYSEIA
ncbi:MAG: hypothetical protein MN733_37175 [Nitrososphaera sp.]|nr:hypothetical protein [Nitrososphaera sp.]